jgi:hypothetical protein
MTAPSMSSEIDSLLALLGVARTSAAVGDAIGAEEALVDAYNRISKLLRDMDMHERRQRTTTRQDVVPLVRRQEH